MAKKRLDVVLVERGLAESRSQAQAMVLAGLVPGFAKPGQQVGDSIEQHATKARELVESGSGSGAGLVATARSVLVEIGAAADEVKSALSSLEQAGEDIRSGIEASDACSQLRDRDFATG